MMNAILIHLGEGIATFVVMSAMIVATRIFIKKNQILAESRNFNILEDKKRLAQKKYMPVIRQNNKVAMVLFFPLIILITPFFTSFQPVVWWRYIADILVIYILYDFLYYLTHRFLFHGNQYFKKVHGLHHQARNPSHIDAQYVHPIETAIGLLLLNIAVVAVGLYLGNIHVLSMAVCFFFFGQLNILNHADVQISGFPYSIATWISKRHHNHHIDMSHGNYATLILLYDKIFGTYE